jgi:hypothetical protein
MGFPRYPGRLLLGCRQQQAQRNPFPISGSYGNNAVPEVGARHLRRHIFDLVGRLIGLLSREYHDATWTDCFLEQDKPVIRELNDPLQRHAAKPPRLKGVGLVQEDL